MPAWIFHPNPHFSHPHAATTPQGRALTWDLCMPLISRISMKQYTRSQGKQDGGLREAPFGRDAKPSSA
jgi:hypothetical protein